MMSTDVARCSRIRLESARPFAADGASALAVRCAGGAATSSKVTVFVSAVEAPEMSFKVVRSCVV
jgi:hypothetical protein